MLVKKIALVTCSTRNPRVNPFITSYIHKLLVPLTTKINNDVSKNINITLETIDIASHPLSQTQTTIPARHPYPPTPHYADPQTRSWSSVVLPFDAFIFVTPQYNWSIPASLKNSIDHLFHEWKGKPAAIVTYGGHGGGKAAVHLRDILHGLRMEVAEVAPALKMAGTTLDSAAKEGEAAAEDVERWRSEGVVELVEKMFDEIETMLTKKAES